MLLWSKRRIRRYFLIVFFNNDMVILQNHYFRNFRIIHILFDWSKARYIRADIFFYLDLILIWNIHLFNLFVSRLNKCVSCSLNTIFWYRVIVFLRYFLRNIINYTLLRGGKNSRVDLYILLDTLLFLFFLLKSFLKYTHSTPLLLSAQKAKQWLFLCIYL